MKSKSRRSNFLSKTFPCSIIFSFLAGAPLAQAVPYYWNTTTTGTWVTGANWSDNATSGGTTGVVPLSTDTVTFNQSSVTGNEVIQLTATTSIAGLTFNNTGTTTLQSDSATTRTLNIGASGITVGSGAGNVIFGVTNFQVNPTLSASQSWTNSSTVGTITSASTVAMGANTLTLAGAGNFSLNTVTTTAAGILDATQSGSLSLSAASANFLGTLNTGQNGGTLTLATGSAFANAVALNIKGGTITSSTSTARALAAPTSVTADFILGQSSGGTGVVTLSGPMNLNGATRQITVNNASDIFSGIVSNGGITKAGSGTLTYSGASANTYSGLTTVSAGGLTLTKTSVNAIAGNVLVNGTGTLTLGAADQIINTSNVEVATGGTFAMATFSETVASVKLSGGAITGNPATLTVGTSLDLQSGTSSTNVILAGAAAATKTTAGTVALTAANTYSGGTTLTLGTLQIGITSAGTVGAVTSGGVGTGTLTLNGGTLSSSSTTGRTLLNAVTVGGNVILGDSTNNGSLTFSAGVDLGGSARTLTAASVVNIDGLVSNGGITKDGSSTLRLTGANTYSGGTIVNAGTVTINGPNVGSVGAITSSSIGTGALTFNGGSISSATGTNRTVLNAVNFTGNAGFGGGGAGTLTFSAPADLGGATRTLTTTVDTTFGGIVSNGGITKGGSSTTLFLNAANTYSGTTTISAGTLQLGSAGSIASSSAISVASGATLNVSAVTGYTVGASASQTLSGSGGVTGAVTIGSLGTHNAGDAAVNAGVGSQAFSSTLNYSNGSIFNWDLNANSTASGFDTVSAGGAITVGSTSIFNVVLGSTALAGINDSGNTFWNAPASSKSWSLSSIFGQAISGSFGSATTSTDVSSRGQFSITGSNLTWTAVPEPTSALAGILLGAGLLRRRRCA